MGGVEYQVLGALRVMRDGEEVAVRPGKPRLLLATLLLRPNRTVAIDVLVDALWGEAPPRSAVANIRSYVRELRSTLTCDSAVTTEPGGYRLIVATDALDALMLERLSAEGARRRRSGDLAGARRVLERCCALWRGQPLEDLGRPPVWEEAVAHLTRRHRFATDELIEVFLATNDHTAAVDLLRRRAGEDPYDEDRWTRLIDVLVGTSRLHEATAAYTGVCRVLADELDVGPGDGLRAAVATLRDSPPSPDHVWASAALPDRERMAARVLAGFPGHDISMLAAAALLATTTAEARRILATLTSAKLLREHRPGRFAMDDATRAALASPDRQVYSRHVRRLVAYYVNATGAAAAAIFPEHPVMVCQPAERADVPAVAFRNDREAAAWIEEERGNLLAAASATLGDRSLVYATVDALCAIQRVRPHGRDWTQLAEAGLRSMTSDDDPGRVAAMQMALGLATWASGQPARSLAPLSRASTSFCQAGMLQECGYAHVALAWLTRWTGDLRAAQRHCAMSLRLRRQCGEQIGQSSTLVLLADIETDAGHIGPATHHAVEAMAIAEQVGYTAGTIGGLGVLGRLAVQRRQIEEATARYSQQLAIADEHEFTCRKASALAGLATCRHLAGHHELALQLADAAVDAAAQAGNQATRVDALNVQGAAHLERGRFVDSFACHQNAKHAAHDAGYVRGRAAALAGLASVTRLYDPPAAGRDDQT